MDELHFAREALGGAVVFGDAPQGGNLVAPGLEGGGERKHGRKAGGFEVGNVGQQLANQRLASPFGLALVTQRVSR